jgi:hypothetical protein
MDRRSEGLNGTNRETEPKSRELWSAMPAGNFFSYSPPAYRGRDFVSGCLHRRTTPVAAGSSPAHETLAPRIVCRLLSMLQHLVGRRNNVANCFVRYPSRNVGRSQADTPMQRGDIVDADRKLVGS